MEVLGITENIETSFKQRNLFKAILIQKSPVN